MILLYYPFVFFYFLSYTEANNEIKEFEEIISDTGSLIVLFTDECCACTSCVEAEVLLGTMSKKIEENLNLYIVKLKEKSSRKLYGIKSVPSLVFIREHKPILYEENFELETLLSWLQENLEPNTKDLDDKNFEHLTQAASGSTTGDWLVAFYDDSCSKERNLIIDMENAGKRLKHKMNIALVDKKQSKDLVERFKITKCPEILFFKLGKMYRFSLPEINASTLVRFAEGFFRNSKPELVPLPETPFDKLVETVYQSLKIYWFEATCFLATLILILFLYLIVWILTNFKKKKND